ncbi:MAG: class I SAM-dependent methyltransferase [Chloroflexi bacterium]|nr:class I SAM-dependent methyltransferase [Ardenticatenaceae bacterium]MBL1128972.1 class I SAM-dependent methyltransferase [Chloroflexota bacterium]NOG35051.1 class I SAM-dependent methyltransferase [Chloroflexota bacterium]
MHAETEKQATFSTTSTEIIFEIRLNQISNDQGSQQAYDTIYTQTDIALRDSFYLWLIELMALQTDDVYLDVSCGHGQLTSLAQRRGIQAYGLDLSHIALRQGRTDNDEATLVSANAQQLPFADGCFTVVSNIGSIEHYTDMHTAVSEMTRVLKPGGRAVVLLPNTFSLMHNIWVAWRHGRTNIDNQPIQRYAARREWQQLLESKGLVVEKTIKYEIEKPRTRADFVSYLRHPKRMFKLIMTPFIPLNLAFCFVFFCYKPK